MKVYTSPTRRVYVTNVRYIYVTNVRWYVTNVKGYTSLTNVMGIRHQREGYTSSTGCTSPTRSIYVTNVRGIRPMVCVSCHLIATNTIILHSLLTRSRGVCVFQSYSNKRFRLVLPTDFSYGVCVFQSYSDKRFHIVLTTDLLLWCLCQSSSEFISCEE